MTLTGLSLVAGKRGRATGRTFTAINPASGAAFAPNYHTADSAEADEALTRAAAAFPVYRKTPDALRAVFLRRIADEIEGLGDELLTRYMAESGLPASRAQSERARTCAQLRLFADFVTKGAWLQPRIDRAQPARQPLPRPDLRMVSQPLGPVVVFGPANFPLAYAVAGGDTVSALAVGCPVIVKAHPSHPGTSELVGHALQRAIAASGLPPGIFSLLFDPGREIGRTLVQHPATQAVGFTGSRHAGRELADLCAARPAPIPFFGELSSLNPVILFPGALRERANEIAAGVHASVTQGMGQFCTCPGVVLGAAGAAFAAFSAQLRQKMADTPTGVLLNATTRSGYLRGVTRAAQQEGVRFAGREQPPGEGILANAALLEADVTTYLSNPTLAEEIFGPTTLLLTHQSPTDLLAFVNSLDGQLTASVHGTAADFETHAEILALLETKAGRIIYNGYPTGVEVCPAMVHGGPWPATTDARFTAVGTASILRWIRPVCYQNAPPSALPPALRDENPLGLQRLVDGEWSSEPL